MSDSNVFFAAKRGDAEMLRDLLNAGKSYWIIIMFYSYLSMFFQ